MSSVTSEGSLGSTRSAMRVPVRAVRLPSISPGVTNQKPCIRAATAMAQA
jgi:hypothetical protein